MDRVYILSHTDLDGYLSAGLVEFYYRRFIDKDASFKHKSWTYGRELPKTNSIKTNFDKVFVVDLCPDFSFMTDLFEHFKNNLIWIDHHIKPDTEFIEQFKINYPSSEIEGIRAISDHTKSAALLVYDYFEDKYNYNAQNTEYPTWLKYCSDFDCWNRVSDDIWEHKVMPLFSYIKTKVSNPEEAYTYIQNRYDNLGYYDMSYKSGITTNAQTSFELGEGAIQYKTILGIYKNEAKHGFARNILVLINGKQLRLKAWICNTQNRSSVIFEQMSNVNDYDVFIPYHYNGERYFYSMYTFNPEIYCNSISIISEDTNIMLSFNGHQDAAGANSTEFIFSK